MSSTMKQDLDEDKMLLNRSEIILHFWRRQPPESILIADPYLYVVFCHLTFKAFLQSQNGCMDSILQFQVITVPDKRLIIIDNAE